MARQKNVIFSLKKCTYYFKIVLALNFFIILDRLPTTIAKCLALGTCKMEKNKANVHKLPSVETLECTTKIFFEKTWTLTTNQMLVTEFIASRRNVVSIQEFNVGGTTYNPKDCIILNWLAYHMVANFWTLVGIDGVCNYEGICYQGHRFHATGMPTEASLKVST